VITVSEAFRDELARKGLPRERIEVVHNAIAADWGARSDSARLRSSLGIPPDLPVILSVGRLSKEKDHLTLLRAVRRFPRDRAFHIVIVGEGPERSAIESAVERFELKGRVTLAGHLASAAPYFGMAQLVVISSRSEGSPNVLLEAMASGVPVVTTRVGGIPEHIEAGRSALAVDPGDAAGMGAAIEQLIGQDRALHRP
jgi:glycosyltransferase involved in cell wall biosynthesis